MFVQTMTRAPVPLHCVDTCGSCRRVRAGTFESVVIICSLQKQTPLNRWPQTMSV